jgi:hypothetical protein
MEDLDGMIHEGMHARTGAEEEPARGTFVFRRLLPGTLARAATALNLHVQTWLMVRARAGGRRRLAPTAFKWRRARSAFFSWRVAAILRLDGIPPLFDRARVPLARKATRRTLPSSDRIRSTHPSYRGWTRPH